MRTILRFLGYLCLIAVVVALVFGRVGDPALLPLVPGWFLLGIVLLSLAAILDRLMYLEFLVKCTIIRNVWPATTRSDLGRLMATSDSARHAGRLCANPRQ